MNLKELQKLCDKSIAAIEKIVPSTKGRINMTAISDPDGKHGDGSYMYPNSAYHISKCFINLYDSKTKDQALHTIAHELIHCLLYRFDHYQAVIIPLLLKGSEDAMGQLHYQTSENFADMLSPIVHYYLKGATMPKQPSPIEEITERKFTFSDMNNEDLLKYAEELFESDKKRLEIVSISHIQFNYLFDVFKALQHKIATLTQDNIQLMQQIEAGASNQATNQTKDKE